MALSAKHMVDVRDTTPGHVEIVEPDCLGYFKAELLDIDTDNGHYYVRYECIVISLVGRLFLL